jgi:hypothetical protein
LESYKKGFMVHISHAEEDKTGIWRAIVNFNGKNKESTFFPKSWTPKQILEKVIACLKDIDFNDISTTQNGKIKLDLICDSFKIELNINAITSEIITVYPYKDEWKHGSLLKKIFGRNS